MLEEDSDLASQKEARVWRCGAFSSLNKTVRVDAAGQLYSFFVA
jgi:hypothetical protein